jgi:phosphatidylglycerol lysyltransferase
MARQTLLMFFAQDNAGVVPTLPFARFFADSIDLVGGVTLIYSLLMLLRPILLRGEPASHEQRLKARAVVEKHGLSSLAAFTLLNDKAYFFSPSGHGLIAYVPKGRGAVVLGDPVGPCGEVAELIRSFSEFCQSNDWIPAFYQTQPDLLNLYGQLGFRALKIGEEAIVDLTNLTTSGKSAQDLRTARNRLTKLGHSIEFHRPPLPSALLMELHAISDEWLRAMHGSEKRFSVGWFDDDYMRESQVAVVRAADGRISAFANLVSVNKQNEITIDMMRHRADMLHGTMDFLFISLFQHAKEQGYERFSLGLSALSGVGDDATSARIEKVINYLSQHLNQFYNFKGLHAYKQKFRPHWEPRYLVFPGYSSLMDVVVALIRAD